MTVGGETYPLPHPFFVLATQNPIEQEGACSGGGNPNPPPGGPGNPPSGGRVLECHEVIANKHASAVCTCKAGSIAKLITCIGTANNAANLAGQCCSIYDDTAKCSAEFDRLNGD